VTIFGYAEPVAPRVRPVCRASYRSAWCVGMELVPPSSSPKPRVVVVPSSWETRSCSVAREANEAM
jgi:hypothetical protein